MLIYILSVTSGAGWCLFYHAMKEWNKSRSPEFSNRLVTLCHGSIMASFGSSQCFINGWAFSNCNERLSITQAALLYISLGYFLFDLIWCLFYQTETKLMIAHHIYSCFAMLRVLTKGTLANQAVCALGLMEMTNPLLQTRWFIRTLGYQKTIIYTIVEVTFLILFIGMRLILGTFITIQVVAGNQDWEFKLLAILIYLVSWAFMIDMYMYIRKKYPNKITPQIVNESEVYETISTATM